MGVNSTVTVSISSDDGSPRRRGGGSLWSRRQTTSKRRRECRGSWRMFYAPEKLILSYGVPAPIPAFVYNGDKVYFWLRDDQEMIMHRNAQSLVAEAQER